MVLVERGSLVCCNFDFTFVALAILSFSHNTGFTEEFNRG